MKIQEIIAELKNSKSQGFQLEKRIVILSSTWLLYKKDRFFYYFDINQKIEFIDSFKYTEEELKAEFSNSNYQIELIIN